MVRLAAALSILVLTACEGTGNTMGPGTPAIAAGSYELISVNAAKLPFTDPQTSITWARGEWVVTTRKQFSASFDVTSATGATKLTRSGLLDGVSETMVYVSYSDGTETLAVVSPYGFTVGLAGLQLGFKRRS